jgi:aspartate/glutamate racemase
MEVAAALRDRGAGAFLLACTELPLVVPPSSTLWPAPAIDPAVFVARRTVVAAGASLAAV